MRPLPRRMDKMLLCIAALMALVCRAWLGRLSRHPMMMTGLSGRGMLHRFRLA